jgi:D-alanyl-D-alanine carboxypeptidase (penicillin-binding protein 5/6)
MVNCRRERLVALCCIGAVFASVFCSCVHEACAQTKEIVLPRVSAEAAILLEWQTGTVLFEKRAFNRMYPASLTKMMTALIALERGRLEDVIQVSQDAATQAGSSMNLRTGDKFTLEDLLYGLMLNSGNDAAWAIAEHMGKGSANTFIELMNQRAKELGAINTKFQNPHGLSHPNHYTTAFDLALIAKTCLRHPYFKNLVGTKEKDVVEADKNIVISLYNTNRLLWLHPGADGVKTGTTQQAGQCLVASATRNGMRLLAVVLNSEDRWYDTSTLLDYGFDNYRLAKAASAGETIVTLPVSHSTEKYVPVICAKDLQACVPARALGLRIEVDLPPVIRAPCSAGTIVGQATLCLGDRAVGYSDLIAGTWAYPRTPWRLMARLGLSLFIHFRHLGLF